MNLKDKNQVWTYATRPMTFAVGTATVVSIIRRFSLAMLLLYHTSSRTEGADVPQVIIKQAK